MTNSYTATQTAIHSIMKDYGVQRINPEYSERHFAEFIQQIGHHMPNRSVETVNKETARIMNIIDNAIEDDQNI